MEEDTKRILKLANDIVELKAKLATAESERDSARSSLKLLEEAFAERSLQLTEARSSLERVERPWAELNALERCAIVEPLPNSICNILTFPQIGIIYDAIRSALHIPPGGGS